MAGSIHNGSVEELDCGSFFDQIDDLLDFSLNGEDIETALPGKLDSFPAIWSTESDSVFSNANSDLSAQLSVPYEDIVQLDWLSHFVEDPFSGGGSLAIDNSTSQDDSNPGKDEQLFHTQLHTPSPVSVLDSSSSSSSSSSSCGVKPNPTSSIPVMVGQKGKARSKRARPAMFHHRPGIQQLISPAASSLSDSENYAESWPAATKTPGQSTENEEPNITKNKKKKKKKKKIRVTIVQGSGQDQGHDSTRSGQAVRKCLHCEITKTPQWRAGPLGPKTLCNACGVRYKSGRLCPEYRPAASPTFVPSVHSNSHKKVLEMRSKMATMSTTATAPEPIPNPAIPSDYK